MVMRIGRKMYFGRGTKEERIAGLKDELRNADCIVIGAGAGLSRCIPDLSSPRHHEGRCAGK